MKEISKEEILKRHTNLSVDPKYSNNGDLLDAMSKFAKQQSIAFGEYIFKNGFKIRHWSGNEWVWESPSLSFSVESILYTTDQLYEKFLQSQNIQRH